MDKSQKSRFIKPNVFGRSLRDPILGKHFKLPGQATVEQPIKLDTSLSYIPVYTHLKLHDAELLQRPPTPPAIKRIQKEEYMDFYTSSDIQASKKNTEANASELLSVRKDQKQTPRIYNKRD